MTEKETVNEENATFAEEDAAFAEENAAFAEEAEPAAEETAAKKDTEAVSEEAVDAGETEAVKEAEPEASAEAEGEEKVAATSRTGVESEAIELSTESFKTFCDDITGMFGVEMKCKRQQVATETIEGLKKRFGSLVAVNSVKAEGALDGTFHMVFNREGLFTLAGLIVMPQQMTSLMEKAAGPEKILENVKHGSLKEAEGMSDATAEAGNMLVGAWNRVFREGLKDHGQFVQSNTFIGNPWDKPEEKIDLSSYEELLFVSYKMTIGSYPTFDCGVIFPRTVFAGAEEKARLEAEAKAKAEAEAKARAEAEAKAKAEAEEKARAEAEEKAKAETEEKARDEAEAKAEAEEKARLEAEAKAKAEAEAKAKAEAEAKAKAEAEEKAKAEAEEKARAEAEEKAKAETEAKARDEAEAKAEAEEKAKAETEEKARAEAEEKAKAETEEKAKAETEEKARAEAEEKAKGEAEEKVGAEAEEKMEAEAEEKAGAESKDEARDTRDDNRPSSIVYHPSSVQAMCAKEIMQKEVVWGGSDDSVQQTLSKMQQHDVGYMVVGRDGVMEGIVSKSDLTGAISPYLRPVFAKWRRPLDDATLQMKIKWIMSRPVRTVKPETSLEVIMENMQQFGGHCLAVVDQEGKVQGMVTVFDIFQALLSSNPNISSVGKTPQAPLLA